MNSIEHRFLVSADIQRWLEKFKTKSETTEQFYSVSTEDALCYYHQVFPEIYTKTHMDKSGRNETVSVSEEEYSDQRKQRLGKLLVKKIYTVSLGESSFKVEKFLKKLEDLYILTAVFQTEKAFRESGVMEGLQPFILKEIDRDEKYHDEHLALHIKPMEYNLPKLFSKIDEYEAPNLFFWQVPQRVYVRDGISLLLYKNVRLLKYYKTSFQNRHFASTLHRLRVLLRRTATLLETFSDLYNPNVENFAAQLLARYYDETKELRYLYFLNELCATKEESKLTLFSELKTLISQEEQAVTQMLLSQPFIQMLNILEREIELHDNQKYVSLKKEGKRVIKEQLENFEALLASTKEGHDDEALESLYDTMDALQTLIEDFFHIIGEKESQQLADELNILLKPLREYRNCKERAKLLAIIKEHSENKTLDITPLLCEHEKELEAKIAYGLKLLRGSRFYL